MSSLHPTRQRALAALAAATMAALFAGAMTPIAAASAAPAGEPAAITDFTEQVNPFVSTEDDFGQDLPGAQAPNSIIKINPMTTPGRAHSGYDYAETKIAGFTHTNLDGVGGSGGGGDLLVVPTYTQYTARPTTDSYAKAYSHDAEEATPGYYGVDLATSNGAIKAEATTDVRTGKDRFTFPKAGAASLVVDLRNNFTSRNGATLDVSKLSDGRSALAGDFTGFFNGYSYKMYYYVETTAPTTAVRTWGPNGALGTAAHQDGTDAGAILDFAVADGDKVGLDVAISPISAAQAKIDLGVEMGDRSFADIKAETAAAWNDLLGTLDVTSTKKSDPDGSLTELFYTHLYRMFGSPVNATSTSGTYRGVDGVVREANGYTHYDGWAAWDDFRKYETIAVGYPDVYRDQMQSLVDLFVAFGASDKSSLAQLTHSVPTVRFERAAVLIADAVSKGAKLTGLQQAWPALVVHSRGGYSNADNVARGYVADRVDDTLGTSYDDWAMATIADSLGKTADATAYRQRATNWTNLYKKDAVTLADGSKTGLIFPKNSAGVFGSPNPEQFESGSIYQGTLWQYNWYAAQDLGGMIDLMGGEKTALSALSFMFGEQAPDDGKRMLHANANEIDLHAPYLFNYVGAPSKTQYWARNIYTKETWNRYIATGSTGEVPSGGGEFTPPVKTKVFKNSPQGFLPTMDNDAGTMSSTYVAAALGLFPVLAGSNEYQIGTPFFENVRISYPTGRTLDITADGVSPDSYYVQSAELNGTSFDRTWVTYDQLTAGGELSFEMGATASDWAADGVSSSSLKDVVPTTAYDRGSSITLSGRQFTENLQKDGVIEGDLDLTLTDGLFAGVTGDDLVAKGLVTATNVPAGLTLTATRVGTRQVTFALEGKAAKSDSLDSIDDLVITLTDAAFSSQPTAGAKTYTTKVTFAGAHLTADTTTLLADKNGKVDASTTLTLGGDTFTGANGRNLVADGDLTLSGLPEGLTASAEKKSDSTLALKITGTLTDESADFALEFADSALSAGQASALTGDGVSGLSSFRIQVDQAWRAQLKDLYNEARTVKKGNYSAASFTAFTAARTSAGDVLANAKATDDDLQFAVIALRSAIKALTLKETSFRTLQAEAYTAWSAGDLKTENGTDLSGAALTNLGGVLPGSWIAYGDIDFAGQLPKGIAVRYVNNSGRSAADSSVEVRLDSPTGELVDTIALPASGPNWNSYTTVTKEFAKNSALTGSHTVYLVFRGTTGANPWLVNLDWTQFLKAMPVVEVPPTQPVATVHIEGESYTSDNGGGLKKEAGSDAAGVALTDVGGSWNGGMITFDSVDLGKDALSEITVRYVNNSSRVAPNARLLVHLDSVTDAPLATVPLPVTGSNWNAYATTKVTLPTKVSGAHKLIIEMRADTTSALPYVGNFDWFEFGVPAAVVTPVPAKGLRVEAEKFVANSGGGLKTEAGTDASGVALTTLAGTYDNAELTYAVDLSSKSAATATIRYVHNTGRSGTNARADLWLDTREGEPFASIPLPTTGANWNAYATATAALPRTVTGSHKLIVALRAQTTSALPYVANVDWIDLGYGADSSALRTAVKDAQAFVDTADRYNSIDYGIFTAALAAAEKAVDAPSSTDDSLAEALRQLNLASSQLAWKVVAQLAYLIDDAEAVNPELYTTGSFDTLTEALADAKAVPADADYATYAAAVSDLSAAYEGLEVEQAPVITVTTTELTFVEGAAPTNAELVAALGATIDKGELTLDASKVAFGTAGSYTATLTGTFRTLAAEPVTVTITITTPADTPSVVSLTDASVTYGTAATLTATVAVGDGVASGDVVLELDGKEYTAALVAGSADFVLPSTLAVGTHTATLRFAGSKGVGAGTATATVTVVARAAAITVAVKNSTYGKSSTVTVAVTSGPTVAATGRVTLRVVGKSYSTTLSKGRAVFVLPATTRAGTLAMIVSYTGDSTTASATAKSSVSIAKATTKVTIKPKSSKPKVGKKHEVTIRVSGISKPTGTLTISVSGKKVTTVTLKSAANGVVKVTLPKITSKGTKTIKVSYSGNASVKSSSASVKVKAKK